MAVLTWDGTGTRFYETGVDHGVLYKMTGSTYGTGVAWNGLTSVTESPDGAELTDLYADNIKYASLRSAETFGGTIEAYTYPDEFAACDGSASIATGVTIGQQPRAGFGFSYRTMVGNDTMSEEDDGYKLHLVYGATASPSEKQYETVNDSPDAITFSWEFSTTPIPVTGHKPTSLLIIDSIKANATNLAALEKILYGSDETVYIPTTDTSVQDGKNYFTRTGSAGNYTYTAFSGDSFTSGTTYYEAVVAGPRLPLPDEVAAIMADGD